MNESLYISTNHISIRVKDLQKSFHFYHKVLQLPIVRIIGSKDKPKLIFLKGLELSQMEPNNDVCHHSRDFFSHIGFEVEKIEEWIKRLEMEGVRFTTRFKDIKFEKEKIAVKVSFFLDPDGIPLELVEWREL